MFSHREREFESESTRGSPSRMRDGSSAASAPSARWTRGLHRVRAIRGPGGAWAFLRWAGAGLRREFHHRRVHWRRLRHSVRGLRIRARPLRADGTPGGAFPAFDLGGYNPVGWRPGPGVEAAALGPLRLLPRGVEASRVVRPRSLRSLRRMHHLEDVAAFHSDPAARAGELARLAAAGVVVHLADHDPRLRPLLGHELHGLMTSDVRGTDARARELLSVRMRRAALREHSSWARAHGGDLPLVSVLLATRRPGFLPWALASVARQTWPRLELVLALHGEGFGDVEPHAARLPHPTKVLRAPADEPLGAVLAAGVEASRGALLAKMDDDDVYGADHLWDLVLAREYSGAQLVGKWLEFVYLAGAHRTLYWRNQGGERWQRSAVAGGTLLVSRPDLERAGGWRKAAPAGVDTALAEDVLRAGGHVYRTHAAGFMMVRHGCGHTWDDGDGTDGALLAKADSVLDGFRPDMAGIEEPSLPHPALLARRAG